MKRAADVELEQQAAPSKSLRLFDGTCVPCREIRRPLLSSGAGDTANGGADTSAPARRPPPLLVFGHGLLDRNGEDPPSLQRALEVLADRRPPVPPSCVPRMVVYDARGHGASSGWELRGPAQFHWRSLAVDMLQVAAAHAEPPASNDGFLLGGYSMGANSALWAALLCPGAIRGLVLYSCTTAWEMREGRRAQLLANAEKKRAEDPAKGELLVGAARADLPPRAELKGLAIPALIVSARDDPVHPAATAEAIAELLTDVKLVLTDKKADLPSVFERALADWVCERFGA